MQAEALLAAVHGAKTSASLRELLPRFDMRRQVIRARLEQLVMPAGDALEPGPARAAALREGPAAMVRLDAEQQLLEAEQTVLHRGEFVAHARLRELEAGEALAAAPAARKAIPGKVGKVREALAALDAAIEALREPVNALAGAIAHGEPFPEDAFLAELLELREAGWKPRLWPTIVPPVDRAYARSVALHFTGTLPAYRDRTSHTDSRADVLKITDDPEPRAARPRPVRRLLETLTGRT